MTGLILAIDEPRASALARELELEGEHVIAIASATSATTFLAGAQALVIPASRETLTPELVSACDRAGVRILALGGAESRLLQKFGLGPGLPIDATGWQIAGALRSPTMSQDRAPGDLPHRLTVVWGPHGSPGRSTVAMLLAVELARLGRRSALVDADTVAPSLALLLGLGDDAPGIAAACRRAELGGLDSAELTRLATVVPTSAGDLDVLPGINRPSRWPELSASRLTRALQTCRDWTEETVIDVAGSFDADEEATYDVLGPRRHAATTAALSEADTIIAVASADPLGISRFLRDYAELRNLTAPTPVTVVVNQVRPGPLGLDARGQIRNTLDRFAGIVDPIFLPHDQRAADAALLHARPMSDLTPRSALVAGARRLATSMVPSAAQVTSSADNSPGSSRVARLLRSARAVRGA
ncbi:CpaE family protein [Microbacterium sp. NPDC090225]|uniref:AAA family ATPase n=1 Tax=Microbacterium sp. NPDC090225 TaxID=3364207 RepID=UPI0038253FC9